MGENVTLISRAQSGDEQAFAELMRAYYAFVYRIVIEIVNNPHDVEEVAQDTFLNVYRGLARYEERMKFRGWLAKIARNRALNWQRTQRFDTVSLNDVSEGTLQAADSPSEQLVRDEELKMIRRAMNTLSQTDRDIARSYYLEGASYDELIRVHGLSYKAISFRLSRAKRTLAKRLQYLLNVAFVPPAMTLKKISSGGFTAMKIGTVPKITAGVVAIIVIVFIGSRQLLSPKDGPSSSIKATVSKTSKPEQSDAEIGTSLERVVTVPKRVNEPQISAEEMEQIEDFFTQLEAADVESETETSQLATEVESNQDTEEDYTPDSSETSESTTQSAEDVMKAYVEAFKNLDFEVMGSLMTGSAREGFENVKAMGFPLMDPEPKDMPEEARLGVEKMAIEYFSRLTVVNSGYVGDEFHFELGGPLPESKIPGMDVSETRTPNELYRMRKENGVWRIYDNETLD